MVVRNGPAARPLRRRHLAASGYFQLLAVAAIAVLTPFLILYAQIGPYLTTLDQTRNTQIASLLAAVAGLIGYRRVTSYPGTRGFSSILPAFMTSYGLAATVLLIGRFPYSGFMLTAGFGLATITMFVLHGISQRGSPMRFYVVPGSEAAMVEESARVEWIALTQPVLPEDASGAIVADLTRDYDPEWERMLAIAAINGRSVYHTKQLSESLTGRVQIDHLSENNFGSLVPNLAYFELKRLIDIVIALLVLPVIAVPLGMIAVAIRLDSPGPAFFRQQRMGYRGQPFHVLKLRTMRHDASAAADPVTRDLDDRVTRLGRFLRRSRVDELPQLWNVLKGEMSLIGPRPEAVELSQWYERELPFYIYRHIVRPGITGWAQIKQGHVAELDDVLVKLHYDFFYVKNFSAWLDLLIAFRTVIIMLSGFGSR